MIEKTSNYISKVGRALAPTINYVVETWLQVNFIHTKLT
jgi:hypothetical protein